MSGCLHGREARLDAFADHQHFARFGEAHHAAATRPEHHLRGIDWRLADAVAGKEGAVNGDRFRISAARYEHHQCGPDAARRVLQCGMKAEGRRQREKQPA